MRHRLTMAVTIIFALSASYALLRGQSGASERALMARAAGALGGQERIKQIKNITLVGYGQYAYMFGGGNITASADAPQKFIAANDLRRVYDLEHGRFQQLERRNMLFPFASLFGHSYALVNLVLDGGIAYDVTQQGGAQRTPRFTETPLHLDGLHMRRAWMLNNPVALIRAALDPATKVTNLRKENDRSLVDLTLSQGDRLTVGIDAGSNLPAFVRWSNPQTNLGQVTFTTFFSGYVPYSGVLLPLGYDTRMDWRNMDYFKVYVDTYEIDGQIADLAAPPAVRNAPEPESPVPQIKATPLAKGIWHLTGGTTLFEFADHLMVFELGGGQRQAEAVIAFAEMLAPGKKVTEYVPSHGHFDHLAGFRMGVAKGLTVISRRGNEKLFRELATHPAVDYPDALERSKTPLKFRPMDEHLRLSDSAMTVDLYWARGNTHMADAVFAYAPAAKLMAEGDIATAAFDYQFWPDNYMDDIEHYHLDVEQLSPVHMQPMKQAEVITLIKGGVARARERCASELAKGNYFPGCPIQTKRY